MSNKAIYIGLALIVVAVGGIVLTTLYRDDAPPVVPPQPTMPPPEPPPAEEKPTVKYAPTPKTVYGIPLPPDAYSFLPYEGTATVMTHYSLAELKDYYEPKAKEFEVLFDNGELFIIGLVDHVGSAVFQQTTPNPQPNQMILSVGQGIQKKEVVVNETRTPKDETRTPLEPYESMIGKPVELRDESGQLIAPGAVWGEPYFPPPGSFYHKDQFKINWGQPFGEWSPN